MAKKKERPNEIFLSGMVNLGDLRDIVNRFKHLSDAKEVEVTLWAAGEDPSSIVVDGKTVEVEDRETWSDRLEITCYKPVGVQQTKTGKERVVFGRGGDRQFIKAEILADGPIGELLIEED
jgi:hypothetical protein